MTTENTAMITVLTPEQEALLPVYADKWIKIGLDTRPVDFENAKKAICVAYEKAGLPHPTQFYVAKGPNDAIRIIQELDPTETSEKITQDFMFGNCDAHWLGYYQYFRDEVGIKECHALDGLIDLANYCGWLSCYEDFGGVVVFQDRPEYIKFDDQDRLHSETGPAILYRDGFSVYSWHGVTIPGEWIENKNYSLTPKIALTWENIEQRRAACEILGWARILRELNATVIDTDVDPMVGQLLEVDIPDIGKERFLKVLCGTGREFAIPVPPEMKTALEANANSYNLPEDVIRNLEVRT